MRSSQERESSYMIECELNKEVRYFPKFRALEAVQEEHEARSRLPEAESPSSLLREEQRNQLLSEAQFRYFCRTRGVSVQGRPEWLLSSPRDPSC